MLEFALRPSVPLKEGAHVLEQHQQVERVGRRLLEALLHVRALGAPCFAWTSNTRAPIASAASRQRRARVPLEPLRIAGSPQSMSSSRSCVPSGSGWRWATSYVRVRRSARRRAWRAGISRAGGDRATPRTAPTSPPRERTECGWRADARLPARPCRREVRERCFRTAPGVAINRALASAVRAGRARAASCGADLDAYLGTKHRSFAAVFESRMRLSTVTESSRSGLGWTVHL